MKQHKFMPTTKATLVDSNDRDMYVAERYDSFKYLPSLAVF